MCATPITTTATSPTSSTTGVKQVPKWLKMKQQNKSSAGKQTAKPTVQKSSGSAQQKPNEPSRNQKRARWAKKAKPVAKPVLQRGPVHEYISACCSAPSRKPRAGMKETVKDPESGKTKDKPKGLGHWRCTACGKVAKVTPRKPEPKEAPKVNVVFEGGAGLPQGLTQQLMEVPVATA